MIRRIAYLLEHVLSEVALVEHDEDETEASLAQLAHHLVPIRLLFLHQSKKRRPMLSDSCEWEKE